MFTRDKGSKTKTDEQVHEIITPLSDTSPGSSLAPPAMPDKSGHGVSRIVTIPPTTGPIPFPRDGAKAEVKADAKSEIKKLTVGRGISLDGKISSCDRLIVDGKVQAELEDCHTVEITENGTFKGAAEIASAEISGHYEGSLTVRENLLIRGTGRVSGTIRYGRLHIEDGGEINGDIKTLTGKP